MKNKFILAYTILGFCFNGIAQNDTIVKPANLPIVSEEHESKDSVEELDAIVIEFTRSLKIKQKGGKYE